MSEAVSVPVTCPECAHTDAFDGDPKNDILMCTECGARIAYGVSIPRWYVNPHPEDPRLVTLRVEFVKDGQKGSVEIVADRQYGGMLATNLASVCPPPK